MSTIQVNELKSKENEFVEAAANPGDGRPAKSGQSGKAIVPPHSQRSRKANIKSQGGKVRGDAAAGEYHKQGPASASNNGRSLRGTSEASAKRHSDINLAGDSSTSMFKPASSHRAGSNALEEEVKQSISCKSNSIAATKKEAFKNVVTKKKKVKNAGGSGGNSSAQNKERKKKLTLS